MRSFLCCAILFSKLTVRADFCVEIARIRRAIRRVAKPRLLVLDETQCRTNIVPTHTLVLPEYSPEVIVVDNDKYAHRIDMFACVHISKTLPARTFTTLERSELGVKGLNTSMLLEYIRDDLGPAVRELGQSSCVLVLDKAPIHKCAKKIIDTFRECGATIERLIYYPTAGAKRLSPLDNSLFHRWKECVRDRCPVLEADLPDIMIEEWSKLAPAQIKSYYKHCGYHADRDLYFDCPNPSVHQHSH